MGLPFQGGSDIKKCKGSFSKRPSKAIPFIHSRPKVKTCHRYAGSSTKKGGQLELLHRTNLQTLILMKYIFFPLHEITWPVFLVLLKTKS